jgi:hypothetical protein
MLKMRPLPRRIVPGVQRGAIALVVTMLLLFTSSIVVFYLNRGVLFEQKTSANQMRSTSAFEVAEAGIEWATGMLNSPYDIDNSCALLATTNIAFRTKYIQTGANSNVQSASNTFPGCKLDGTALTCSCPNVPGVGNEAVASLGVTVLPSFTVTFTDVGDSQAVRVTATGCTAQAGACKPVTALSAATTGSSDAWAQVSVILKLRPLLRAAPSAALTCGTSCAPGGSYNIINTDVASNGYLVDAGTIITPGNGVTYQTIPGQPIQNAVISSDASLNALACANPNDSTMFKTYFGLTLAEYAASPQTKSIACPNNCTAAIDAALGDGWKNFYFPAGFSYHGNGTIGAAGAGNGVNFVTLGEANINGNATLYGLVYANEAVLNDLGTGNSTIIGAVIACNAMNSNGNGTISYDAGALGGTGLRPGLMVRVPGSWRDFNP